ncbi:hypothetical protein [Pseudonocardia sp. GCM10023141]|uniref:hypothetical protein n=1 Tax=Pseudonocardia sp. GCM10023141 TaxID=3252653 RepID=UPI00361A4489
MALVAWGAGSGVAMAHSTAAAGVVDMAATLGERELTVTISLPSGGTGALPIAVTTRGSAPEATMRVQAVPGATGDRATSEASVRIGPAQRSASTVLQIDRPGPWQIVLSDGAHVARLPLTLDAATAAGWVWAVRGGLAAAVIFAVAALVLRARRRPRWAVGLGGVAVAGVAVVVTAALLGGSTPAASPGAGGFIGATDPAAMPGMDMAGMGHNGMVMTSPAMSAGDMSAADMAGGAVVLGLRPDTPPVAGQAMQLGLDLTDGSTGNPVDDLAVHDDALIHLAVIGPDRRLWHVHPVRTAPGRYTVELTPSGPGRYGVFAELERSGGGHQVVRSAFTVEGTAGAAAPGSAGAGRRDVAGMTVDTTVASPVAGRPSRIALTFTDAGAPVGLQAWLGMAGHLMILGPTPAGPGAADAALDPADPTLAFAHVHDMTPPTATGYGPTTTFTYAFPRAGRYQLWAQVQRDWQLVTVPITVDVTAAPTA